MTQFLKKTLVFKLPFLLKAAFLKPPLLSISKKGQSRKEPDYYLPHPPPSFLQIKLNLTPIK